jgi:exo-1,4-beta-D-glucosaminidase
MNYESVRPMFEAFIAYRAGNPYLKGVPATGVFHWMLNAAWPKFFWQLYDYYLVPGSAYFSAKEANKPLHVIYNYANKSIYLSNNTLSNMSGLGVTARLWDSNAKRLVEQHWSTSIRASQAYMLGELTIPDDIATSVFFVELILKDKNNKRLDRNVYWLATTPDKMGVDTTILQQADYQELNKLPKANLTVHYTFSNQGSEKKLIVKLENKTENISFFNRLIVKTQQHVSITPIDWSDNFITLFPHQSETITADFNQDVLQGEAPVFAIEGVNSSFEMHSSP